MNKQQRRFLTQAGFFWLLFYGIWISLIIAYDGVWYIPIVFALGSAGFIARLCWKLRTH